MNSPYAWDMKDALKKIGRSVDSLIGPGRRFKSARELAQRAQMLGYVENADSFARSVSRAKTGDHDSQISTISIIAKTAGVDIEQLFAGVSFEGAGVNPPIKEHDRALSMESHRTTQAKLFEESIANVSREMRAIIDDLAEADRSGGQRRDILIGSIGAMLLTTRDKVRRKTK